MFAKYVHNFGRSKNDKWKNPYFKYMWFHVQLAHKILSGIYSMYNNTQALAAAELQSFAGILQPHFHAHEITLKTNGTWPTQLFFAHPIKLFHFASVSVWPGGRNWGNKMRIWRLFADPELFGSPQRCRILKCVFNFNGTNSFKCSLLRLLFTESDNEFRIDLMRIFMNVFNI